jgi:hypothetical protein
MKDGLLSRVPAGHKERFSLGAKDSPQPLRDLRAELKHGRQFFRSGIGEFYSVSFGNDQRMPVSQRTGGQKRQAQGILGHLRHGRASGNDLTEDARSASRFFVNGGHS